MSDPSAASLGIEGIYRDRDLIFKHDGTLGHKDRQFTHFPEDHGIEVSPWLGNSLDMNPIDNLDNSKDGDRVFFFPPNKQIMIEELLSLGTQCLYDWTFQGLTHSAIEQVPCKWPKAHSQNVTFVV